MRGKNESSGSLFSYVDLEARVPRGHPAPAVGSFRLPALGPRPVSPSSRSPGPVLRRRPKTFTAFAASVRMTHRYEFPHRGESHSA